MFRPPAVPLVTHDPYFSVWSPADRLTDTWTRHWTGANQGLCGLVRIDDRTFRFVGPEPASAPAMEQVSLEITPTKTVYTFEAGGLRLTLTFLSPVIATDLELVSRPVSYLTWVAESIDGKPHRTVVYLDICADWVVNTPDQPVVWSRYRVDGMEVLSLASQQQSALDKVGDNVRIDWGQLYAAVPTDGGGVSSLLASDRTARGAFLAGGTLPATDDLRMPRPVCDQWPVAAFTLDLGAVGSTAVSRRLMLAYDDRFSIEYMYRKVRPYWRRNGMEAAELLQTAAAEYGELKKRCARFDAELTEDLTRVGGAEYAQLAALAYRQCLAAHKLVVDADDTLLYFSKENFSNGCIATVDVTYPSSPFFLLLNPELLKAQLTPILNYAGSGRWRFPFAPHDLGTYPKANGQVYGGGERSEDDQMPVEESGNMLILLSALAKAEGNTEYVERYWLLMRKWAGFLMEKGLDPENQLCTDDFAGHLAHNTNLSLKAIMALGSYAQICEQSGHLDEAAAYWKETREMAAKWQEMAKDDAGNRLAFDQPGTWSQKYNLVWDRLFGLNLFPPDVAREEIASYAKRQNAYGLPLDNRATYTKLDWVVWTATMAESRQDFEAFVSPLLRFVNESESRVPLTDWFDTISGKQIGFQARSVVGGVYLPMLLDSGIWKKWAGASRA